MKTIITLQVALILFAHLSYSQICNQYITVEEDATGSKLYSGKDFINLINNGDTTLQLLAMLSSDNATLILSVTALEKIKCVDPNDEIYFTFEDNTKYNLSGNQDFNCKGALSIYFGDFKGNNNLLKLLLTKKVMSIRLYCRAGTLDVALSKPNSDELFGEITCLNKYLNK
jgi:hypothetical protein